MQTGCIEDEKRWKGVDKYLGACKDRKNKFRVLPERKRTITNRSSN